MTSSSKTIASPAVPNRPAANITLNKAPSPAPSARSLDYSSGSSPVPTRFGKQAALPDSKARFNATKSPAPSYGQLNPSRPGSIQKPNVSSRKLETNYAALNRTTDVLLSEQEVASDPQRIFDSVTPFYTPTTDDLYIVPLFLKGMFNFISP